MAIGDSAEMFIFHHANSDSRTWPSASLESAHCRGRCGMYRGASLQCARGLRSGSSYYGTERYGATYIIRARKAPANYHIYVAALTHTHTYARHVYAILLSTLPTFPSFCVANPTDCGPIAGGCVICDLTVGLCRACDDGYFLVCP